MAYVNHYINSNGTIEIDICGTRAIYLTKSVFGWTMEVYDPRQSDGLELYWVYPTLREAWAEGFRFLRDTSHARRWRHHEVEA